MSMVWTHATAFHVCLICFRTDADEPPTLHLAFLCAGIPLRKYPTALRATSATALDESIPTRLQIPRRCNPKSANLDPQIAQKIIKNRSKINQKSIKNSSKIDLGGSWGGLGALLTPRWPQERKRCQKVKVLFPYWGPFWSPKSIKIDPKSDLKCDQFFDRFGDRVLEQFGANLAPF